MASHYEIKPDQRGLAMRIAQRALSVANGLATARPGNVFIPNKDENGFSDGTGTWIGSGGIGDGGVMPWVGDTTPPGKPTGVSATSAWGVVYATWDGTLEGGVPADFAYVTVSIEGVEVARLTEAGKVAAEGYADGESVDVSFVAYDAARSPQTGQLAPNASPAATVTITVSDERDEIDQAVQDASEKADALAQQVEQVETTVNGVQQDVTELTTQVSGAVSTANEALTAASTVQQDIDGFKTTVEQTYETKSDADAAMAQEVLDRNSAIEQSATSVMTQVSENYVNNETGAAFATKTEVQQASDQVLTTVESEYQSKDGMSSYATKSYVDQQDDSISTTVSEAVTTANGAMEKATTLEQTVDGFEARITDAQSAADAAQSTANSASSAAAEAKQEASDAAKVATNYLGFSSSGLVVGTNSSGTGQSGLQGNVRLTRRGMEVRSGSTVLASYGANLVELGKNSTSAQIKMCGNLLTLEYSSSSGHGSIGATSDNYETRSIQFGSRYAKMQGNGTSVEARNDGDLRVNWTYELAGDVYTKLWSGTWSSGSITVPNLYKYRLFAVAFGTNALPVGIGIRGPNTNYITFFCVSGSNQGPELRGVMSTASNTTLTMNRNSACLANSSGNIPISGSRTNTIRTIWGVL